MLYLLQDLLRVFLTVQAVKDVTNQLLLVFGELADAGLGDVPVVVDLRLEFMAKREAHTFALFLGQTFVELSDQRFRRVRRRFRSDTVGRFNDRAEGQQRGGGGCFEEATAIETIAALARRE